ncbi:adhesion G protein-coupled receptor E2 isoform X2 [Prionailurus iriomotensis]
MDNFIDEERDLQDESSSLEFNTETERNWGGGRERRRQRIQSRLHAPSCQHRAQQGAGAHKLRDHDLSESLTSNGLSPPGAPQRQSSLMRAGEILRKWPESRVVKLQTPNSVWSGSESLLPRLLCVLEEDHGKKPLQITFFKGLNQ